MVSRLSIFNKKNLGMDESKKGKFEFKILGNWEYQSRLLKDKFPILTDSDLIFKEGEENELLNRIMDRVNIDAEKIIEIINEGQQFKGETKME